MPPLNPDQLIGTCYVAKTKSGWAWLCKDCGRGGINGRGKTGRNLAELAARQHHCDGLSAQPTRVDT